MSALQPPVGYVCRICGIRGHLVIHCPNATANQTHPDTDKMCKYYDPFSTNPNCSQDRCYGYNYKHVSQQTFQTFCTSKLKNNPRELKQIADDYYNCRNSSCAMYIYDQLLDKYPNNASYASGYARVLEELNDYANAQKYHLKSINISPTDDRCHDRYAVFLHNKLGKIGLAKKYFINALKLNPMNPNTNDHFGRLLEDEGHYQEAEQHYLKSIEIEHLHKHSNFHLALLYHYKLNNLTQSKYYFDKMVSLKNNYNQRWWFGEQRLFSRHYFEYGLLLKDIGDIKSCLDYFNIALEKIYYDDDKANIYYEIGRIYDDHFNDVNNAKWYFNEAKNLNPKQYTMFFNEFMDYTKTIHKCTLNEQAKGTQYNDEHKCDDNQKINENSNDLKENKNDYIDSNKTASQIAFKKYLMDRNLGQYYDGFMQNECDDLKYFEVFDETFLKEKIKLMECLPRKYFLKEIKKFMENKTTFEHWLRKLGLEYHESAFHKNGIYTLLMFHEKVKTKSDLTAIIGSNKEFDINLLWDSNNKQTRKLFNKSLENMSLEGRKVMQ